MNDRPSRLSRLLCAALAMLLLTETAGGALAVVRLREDKADIARSQPKFENDRDDNKHHINTLDAQIAGAMQPEILRARIEGRLAAPTVAQVVWVRMAPPVKHQAEPQGELSFHLATLEPSTTKGQLQ